MPVGAERLVVGLVRGLHGLRGALRIEPLSDEPDRFRPGSILFPEGTERRLTVDWSQEDGPGLLVRFREIRSREAAGGLLGGYLEAESPGGPAPGSYWWHEVIGVAVTTDGGEKLGEVADVFRAGGGDVYVVRGGLRGEVLVPAVRSVVREFDPRNGRLVIEPDALGLDEPVARRPRGRRSSKAGRRPGTATTTAARGAGVTVLNPEEPDVAGQPDDRSAQADDGSRQASERVG